MEGSIAGNCMGGAIILFILFIVTQIVRSFYINTRVVKVLRKACRKCTDDSVDTAICVLNHVNLADMGWRTTFECCRASWKLLSSEQNISTAKKQELRRAILTSGVNL